MTVERKITRRQLIALAGATGGASLLTSCAWFGGSSTPTPAPDKAPAGLAPVAPKEVEAKPKVVERVVERVVTATPAVPDFNAQVKAAVEATVAARQVQATAYPTPKGQELPVSKEGKEVVQAWVDRELKPGEMITTEHPGFVTGDVLVSNPNKDGEITRMFDNNADSGLIVVFKKGTKIIAPYGADVIMIPGLDEKVIEQLVGQAVVEMRQKGCEFVKTGKGCRWVYVAEPGMAPQSQVTPPQGGGVVGK